MTLLSHDASGARIAHDDPWIAVEDGAALPDGDVIVTLARFRSEAEVLRARPGRLGVRVSSDVDPDALAQELRGVALLAIEFPKFGDGRGYSIARVLKSRGGFAGELRAVGNVLRDQLFYMARCGFTSFDLDPSKDPDEALAAFTELSVTYQPAEDHAEPIWRRRAHS